MRKTYQPLIEGARTPDEMRAILRLMIGELNSSHSGMSRPRPRRRRRGVVGQLGLSSIARRMRQSGKFEDHRSAAAFARRDRQD